MSATIDSFIKLLLFQAFGEAIAYVVPMPIPGPVIGLVLLLLVLAARSQEDKELVAFSTRFLSHLSLLFIPAAVGIMAHVGLLANEWTAIVIALSVSALATIVVTAYVLRAFKK